MLQLQEVTDERFRETEAFLTLVREDLAQKGVRNLEAVELGLREAITKDARRGLEGLYRNVELPVAGGAGRLGEKCHSERATEVETICRAAHPSAELRLLRGNRRWPCPSG